MHALAQYEKQSPNKKNAAECIKSGIEMRKDLQEFHSKDRTTTAHFVVISPLSQLGFT
jgi:hypothetical protein